MTERVGTGLQNQLGRFDSGSTLQKNENICYKQLTSLATYGII